VVARQHDPIRLSLQHCHVDPPEMTGIGAGAVAVNQYSHHGPFAAGRPSAVAQNRLVEETWPLGPGKALRAPTKIR
jgi:hypothetical protein